MKNNHAVIICVESVFIEDLIVAFVSSKAFSRQRSGTKHNRLDDTQAYGILTMHRSDD